MKHFILLIMMTLLLSSCFWNKKELADAKQALLNGGESQQATRTAPDASNSETLSVSDVSTTTFSTQSEGVQIEAMSSEQFLSFDDISLETLSAGEVKISGNANKTLDKIVVSFSNASSKFPDDTYTLTSYKPKEGTFSYNASSKYQVFDYGKNVYLFTAYANGEESKTKLTIDYESSQGETLAKPREAIAAVFPSSSEYGEPVELSQTSTTYSGLKGFEVRKESFIMPNCTSITDFLKDRMNSWFYWNTCRDIVAGDALSFNVLRLDGENYIYEKHYIDAKHGLYASYELERGTGIDKDNIAEKNKEFKDKSYPSAQVADKLVSDIVKS